MLLSAGPGTTRPYKPASISLTMIPRAISESNNLKPSFGFPLVPYHSMILNRSPRTVRTRRPFGYTISLPSLLAHQPTENGLLEPQSNDLSILQECGIGNG